MRTTKIIVAAVIASLTSPATADIFSNIRPLFNFTFDMTSLMETGPVTFNINITGPALKPVVGFYIDGLYLDDGAGVPTWWASDLTMTVTSPTGRVWTVGGWDNVATRDENWNGWAGSGAGLPGNPAVPSVPPNDGQIFDPDGNEIGAALLALHTPWKNNPQPKEGRWTVVFATDFAAAVPGPRLAIWDLEFGLLNIPAPGALALLGVAGLLTTRRRRR